MAQKSQFNIISCVFPVFFYRLLRLLIYSHNDLTVSVSTPQRKWKHVFDCLAKYYYTQREARKKNSANDKFDREHGENNSDSNSVVCMVAPTIQTRLLNNADETQKPPHQTRTLATAGRTPFIILKKIHYVNRSELESLSVHDFCWCEQWNTRRHNSSVHRYNVRWYIRRRTEAEAESCGALRTARATQQQRRCEYTVY